MPVLRTVVTRGRFPSFMFRVDMVLVGTVFTQACWDLTPAISQRWWRAKLGARSSVPLNIRSTASIVSSSTPVAPNTLVLTGRRVAVYSCMTITTASLVMAVCAPSVCNSLLISLLESSMLSGKGRDRYVEEGSWRLSLTPAEGWGLLRFL